MALTLSQTGSEIATEKLVISALSDDPLVTSVRMSIFINDPAQTHILEHLPILGSTDTFDFEVNSIVKDYFASEFLPLTGVNQTTIENAIVAFKFEEVIDGVIQGLSYDYNVLIKNITQDTFEIEDFDPSDYDCGDAGSSVSKFLTSSPSPLPIGDNTSVHVSCLTTSYTGATPKQEWEIQTLLNGVLVATLTEDVDVPLRGLTGFVVAGKFDIATYRFDFDSSTGIDEVRVLIRDIASPFTTRSETKVFKLNDACERAITLSWLNEFGAQDTFTFLGNITRTGEYTDSTFKRTRPVNPLSTNVGDLVYKSSYNYEYDIFSDRMPELAVQWLSKILINKRAAIQSEASSVLNPLALTNDQYFGSMPEAASYFGLVDGGNGFAYGAPGRSGNFLKYDLTNDTLSTIPTIYPAGVGVEWYDGIKSNVNSKIYYMNEFGLNQDILVFDTVGETYSTIGLLTSGYRNPAITPSGVIYANSVSGVSNILKIDTNTDTVTEIAVVGKEGAGFAVYKSGFVYLVPNGNLNEFYKLDVSNDTIATVAAPLLTSSVISGVITTGGKIYVYIQGVTPNNMLVIDTSDDSSYEFDTGVALASAYLSTFLLSDDNVYLLGYKQADVLKIDTSDDSISVAGAISNLQDYAFAMVVNDAVYAPSGLQNEPVIKLTFEEGFLVTASKYFPITITTEDTVLADKFTPETLFRLKFRLANRRKGLK